MPSSSAPPIAEPPRRVAAIGRVRRLPLLDRLQATLIVATFVGYPVAALVPTVLGWESRLPAMALRALVVLVSMLLLVVAARIGRPTRTPVLPLAIFAACWTVLLARFVSDVVIEGVQPSVYLADGTDFLVFVVGASLLPTAALFVPVTGGALRCAHAWLCVLLATLVAAYTWQFRDLADEGSLYRAQAEALNAITYASLGALLILLVSSYPFDGRQRWAPWVYRLAAVGLGGWALITAASRGPIVALLVAGLPALWMAPRSRRRGRWLLALMIAAALAVALQLLPALEDSSSGLFLASRVSGFEDDVSTLERLYLFQASWSIFMDSPLTGGAIAEPLTHSYPHNVILEALMVGGVGLFVLVSSMLIYCLGSAREFLTVGDDRRFVGTIIIFYCVMSMLSGSLYTGPELWAAFALAASCRNGYRRSERR